jgi:spoIIIJ-associated protein
MSNGTDTETWLEEFLADLLELSNLDVSVEEMVLDDEQNLVAQLSGPDSARAIGREGVVLEAIQHLVISAAIHAGVTRRRLIIDVERYRERREQKVREDAAHFADEVLSSGRPYDLAPMSPRERRLVHMAVSEIDGVTTESVGDGEDRFVRVLPE